MPAPSLLEVQHWMQARIAPAGPRPAGAGVRLNPQRGTDGEARLAVYAGGYLARTREALGEVYEAVRTVVGPRAFSDLARAYAAHRPSREYNLTFVGQDLPAFLADHPLTARLPFLPDLARLEWLVCQAFHARQLPPLDPAAMAGRTVEAWSRSRLRFQPSVAVVASSWPILDIWQARAQPRSTINLPVTGRPQAVLIFRRGVQVQCALLEPPQQAILTRLLAGCTLGEACATLADPERLPLAAWFASWAREGLLVACAPPAPVRGSPER